MFWLTMEFGVVDENGVPKALGAGLLSSAGELSTFQDIAQLLSFDLDAMASTRYETDEMQSRLFVAPSCEAMSQAVLAWLQGEQSAPWIPTCSQTPVAGISIDRQSFIEDTSDFLAVPMTIMRTSPAHKWLKRIVALGALLLLGVCVAWAMLWPAPHPGKSLPTHALESPAHELRWVDPERQREGHTCGMHAVSVLYASYGLRPEDFRLRERLGIDVPAVKLVDSSTGMLPTDLLRVLGEDGFQFELLAPLSDGAARKFESHLEEHMALCVMRLGGSELHWVAARQDPEGRLVMLDSLGGRVRDLSAGAFLAETALSVVLVRPRLTGEPPPAHPHGTGAAEMGRILGRK